MDKNSASPLYRQFKNSIQKKIKLGEYTVGKQIPTTAKLCKIHQISTTTVRRAISELIAEGLLMGVTGKGTFVVAADKKTTDKKGSKLIGVIIPNSHSHPFFREILQGAEDVLDPLGYHLITSNSNTDAEKERQLILKMREKMVEGIILIPVTVNRTPAADQIIKEVTTEGFPVVFLDRNIPDIQVDYVTTNNEEGGYLATRHLITLGHQRISFFAGTNANTIQERLVGYKRALNEFKIPYDPLMIKYSYVELQYEDLAYRNTMEILHLVNPPTAIFSSNDTIILGIYKACWELGISIPKDLSVIGFDDVSYSAFLYPPLTTIHQPKVEMGQKGAKLLLNLIRGVKNNPSQIILENYLVERSSCAPPKKKTKMSDVKVNVIAGELSV